jgi:hypothetical protein
MSLCVGIGALCSSLLYALSRDLFRKIRLGPAGRYIPAVSVASPAPYSVACPEFRFQRKFQIRLLSHKSENSELKSNGIVGPEIR